ncbi:MAG: hypothetical protein V3S14_16220, partial [Anaerolineae bacterium]
MSDYSGGRGRGRVAGTKGFRKGRGHKSALVISGFAYTLDASATNPKNMLMIIGKWDEYRDGVCFSPAVGACAAPKKFFRSIRGSVLGSPAPAGEPAPAGA